MYKLLLCWRYLKTRYLAMACIISVMLGVATLIVVNSVMSGFSTKLQGKLHDLTGDFKIEARGMEGFGDVQAKMDRIRRHPFLGPRVEAMAAMMEVFALLKFDYPSGESTTRVVHLVGVDAKDRGAIGGFKEFLVDKNNRVEPSFAVPEDFRKLFEVRDNALFWPERVQKMPVNPDEPPGPVPPPSEIKIPRGVILGNLIASVRRPDPDNPSGPPKEFYYLKPGDSVVLTTVGGQKLTPVYDRFIVVDYFKSEMSDYDSNYVFVPLDYLQHLRTMQDRVTSIQLKLKNYDADKKKVKETLQEMFALDPVVINTWEDKQGPLLAAISIEKGILNVLLFLIIAVAGFGILAIFSMIVTEKTRDIGILKALGASNGGVMKIFLSYGLLLGLVGSGMGTTLGLVITNNINAIEKWLSRVCGLQVFNRDIYYFGEIPTDVQVSAIFLVNIGAVLIAVLFSVLPALRAALLHPVRALRYE